MTDVASLKTLTDPRAFIGKQLLVDVVTCPPSGATAKQPQPNPLLDNIEAMALGDDLRGDRRELYLLSDDNGGATQTTRLYRFSVRVARPAEAALAGAHTARPRTSPARSPVRSSRRRPSTA